jgi:hypothetical protein
MPWAGEPEELPLLELPLELLDELLEPPELLDELLPELPPLELLPPELDELELLLSLLPQALSAQAAIAMSITLRINPPKPGRNFLLRSMLQNRPDLIRVLRTMPRLRPL